MSDEQGHSDANVNEAARYIIASLLAAQQEVSDQVVAALVGWRRQLHHRAPGVILAGAISIITQLLCALSEETGGDVRLILQELGQLYAAGELPED